MQKGSFTISWVGFWHDWNTQYLPFWFFGYIRWIRLCETVGKWRLTSFTNSGDRSSWGIWWICWTRALTTWMLWAIIPQWASVTYTSKKTLAIMPATCEIKSVLQNCLGYIFHFAVCDDEDVCLGYFKRLYKHGPPTSSCMAKEILTLLLLWDIEFCLGQIIHSP